MPAHSDTHRIMIVDDDADIRLIVRSSLNDHFEVVEAHDGLDALEKIEKYEPDLVVMDMMMPLMDGFQACEAIRRKPRFSNLQVIFLTGHGSRDNITRSYNAGGNVCLQKPVNPERLLRNVRMCIDQNEVPVRPKQLSLKQIQIIESGGHAPPPKPIEEHEEAPPREETAPEERPATATEPEADPPRAPRHAPLASRPARKPAADTPRSPAPPPRAQTPPPAPADSTATPRVMIVEDDKDLVTLMDMALADNFEVVVAHDGMDAIEKIVRAQPDLLVVDVMMPKMNGYQFIQSVRSNRAFSAVPIIVASAKASPKDREYAKRIGATAFLGKPFHMEDLLGVCAAIAARPDFQPRAKTHDIAGIRRHDEALERKREQTRLDMEDSTRRKQRDDAFDRKGR